MTYRFTNNATTTLASSLSSSATTVTVATGFGSLYPSTETGNEFTAVLVDSDNNLEFVLVTSRSGDVFTVIRGQEGTVARSFTAGDRLEHRLTADALNNMAQLDDSTGTGGVVREIDATLTTPTLIDPALGTPTALVGTNITGMAQDLSIGGNADTATDSVNSENADKITNTGGWSVTPDGETLYFNYNGVNVAKLGSTGLWTVKADVAAFGTV